jgi:hypothetical protein
MRSIRTSCQCAFRDARARRRAVQWLTDNSLIYDDSAERFLRGHADPALPKTSPDALTGAFSCRPACAPAEDALAACEHR